MKSVTFNGPLNEIPDSCFAGCLALKQFSFPIGVKAIGKNAFFNCQSLSKIEIPEGIEVIEEGAFQDCKSLIEISLPLSLKRIEKKAFLDCSRIKVLDIPENVEFIGKGAFAGMSNLAALCLNSAVPPETDDEIMDYSAAMRKLVGKPFHEKVSLLVPPDSEPYANHPYWGKFTEKESYSFDEDEL
jgi:hypothetical protein